MTSFPELSLQPQFDDTLRAIFIGNVVAAVLFGITTVQVCIYYQRSRSDGWVLQGLIFFLWILDAAEQASYTAIVYHYTVTNFANPLGLLGTTPALDITTFVAGLSDTLVRCIFGYRLWKFSGGDRLFLLLIIAALDTISFAGNMTMLGLLHTTATQIFLRDMAGFCM